MRSDTSSSASDIIAQAEAVAAAAHAITEGLLPSALG